MRGMQRSLDDAVHWFWPDQHFAQDHSIFHAFVPSVYESLDPRLPNQSLKMCLLTFNDLSICS